MKKIVIALTLAFGFSCTHKNDRKISSERSDELKCKKVSEINKSIRHDCKVQGEKGQKTFHVLELQGSFPEVAYDHGYLMAKEMKTGVLPEAINQYYASIGGASTFEQEIFKNLQTCFRKHLHRSVSREFRKSSSELLDGMTDGLKSQGLTHDFSESDFLFAYYGIEMSNVFTGLDWQITNRKMDALKTVLANCALPAGKGVLEGAAAVIKSFAQKQFKMGCIGSIVPSNYNTEGALIHSRNLDSHNLEGWNKAPLIALISEPGYYKYISAATAGLTYSGGISGFNEKGISVSLHQMDATHYDPSRWFGKAEIMPFVQQRILREASSIDEAIEVVKKIKHFAAWTILISDSKNDESASIEISARKFAVARRRISEPMGQGNSFLDPSMAQEFFQPRYGHSLETLSRLTGIEQGMKENKGSINLDWVISKHAGHTDLFEGRQSFGKTAVKAINVMSTFSIPKKNQFWVTLGDFQPAVHGSILGFEVDFNNFKVKPIGIRYDHSLDETPYWRLSFERYVNAYIAYDHGNLDRTIEHLNHAIALAEEDDFFDSTYHMVRARIHHKNGNLALASEDFEKLWENRAGMITHKQAIIAMLSVASNPKMDSKLKKARLDFAEETFSSIKSELLALEPIRGPLTGEIDLNEKLKIIASLRANQEPKLQGIGFVLGE